MEPPQWPPRSPYEALLSSPTARQQAQRRHHRASPSPSPLNRSRNPSTGTPVQRKLSYDGAAADEDDDEDDDEETLQLRLQALEAKLKLRKLQTRKARLLEGSGGLEDPAEGGSRSPTRATSGLSARRREAPAPRSVLTRPQSSTAVQVPLSPEKRRAVTGEARSPGRVLLGIDKGLRGRNVSLRKAPTPRSRPPIADDPFASKSCPSVPRSLVSSTPATSSHGTGHAPEKSFSQRIAETRQQDKDLKERNRTLERLRRQRSSGFGIHQAELDAFKSSADSRSTDAGTTKATSDTDSGFSRDQVMRAYTTAPGGLIRKSNTASGVRNSRPLGSSSGTILEQSNQRSKSSASSRTVHRGENADQEAAASTLKASQVASTESSQSPELFESFSSTHLSRRILPHSFLTRTLESKTVVLIPDLLREIKAPDFCLPPSLETCDLVVVGTIASKSAPLSHKSSQVTSTQSSSSSRTQAAESEANVNGKYMVFTLTDLKWTLDLYLFTTAYTRFWKLTPGTVIAILNPSVMPPPRGKEDTGRWSLVLSSSDDTILEIGTARDLGFCKATKRDGKPCNSWVDVRKTEFCEWHVDRGVENCRRGRMEVQGMSAPFAPGGRRGGRMGFFGGKKGSRGGKGGEGHGLLKEGRQYDRESRSTYFIAPSFGGGNAASLLDAEETGPGRGMSREEALRKRLAEREKEKDVARKLGEMGNGTGAEYLRLRHGDGQSRGADDRAVSGVPVDAGALGLLGNSARNVQLSPLKRRASGGGMSVSRKKTRFVTAKGIREAGRESLGVATGLVQDEVLDRGLRLPDEDDLDIV
ncbi:hypothetical protein MMC15_004094 [Xylographa vitiligo]|nr:hypothetical protein [Xylographa vitiligo]